MTLIPLRPLMKAPVKHGFAQDAFNIDAATQAKAAVGVHEMFYSAATLQGADLANGFMGEGCDFTDTTLEDRKEGTKNIARAIRKYGENSPVPIVPHLDHGRDFDSYAVATAGRYTSVMVDGSSPAFDKNVGLTREVMKYAHARGVSAEEGLRVLAGTEDHVLSEGPIYTNPLKAAEFFHKTDVDALAIFYGTVYGAFKGKNAKPRKKTTVAIRECLDHEGIFRALVSHGSPTVPEYIVDETNGSGGMLTDAYGIVTHELQTTARCGINKINVDTDTRSAVTRNVEESPAGDPDKKNSSSTGGIYELLEPKREWFGLRVFFAPVMDTVMTDVILDEDTAAITDCVEQGVKEVMGTLIVQLGSYGKAPLVGQVLLEEMAKRYKKTQI